MNFPLRCRPVLERLAIVILLFGPTWPAFALAADRPLFVLQRIDIGYRLETVPAGWTRLLDSNPETGIIAAILPPAPAAPDMGGMGGMGGMY